MNHLPALRNSAHDLQNMNIVVVHGTSETHKNLCVVGWAEDKPHDGESALVLQEPLAFVHESTRVRFIGPTLGLPASTEIFEYTKVDIYEGVTEFAALYISHVLKAREYKPVFEGGFIPESAITHSGPLKQQEGKR